MGYDFQEISDLKTHFTVEIPDQRSRITTVISRDWGGGNLTFPMEICIGYAF